MTRSKKLFTDSYLDRISFDPKLGQSFKAKYLTNIRLVALLMMTIVIIGVVSFLSLPRRLNPEVKIPIVTVVTALPGAGPQDVETLVTIPLEDAVQGVKGIDTEQSISQDNVSAVTIQFLSTVDAQKAKQDVQTAVNSVTTLPKDARTPKVTAIDFENQTVWKFLITTNGDFASLEQFSENLKDKLEAQPHIDKVVLSGNESQEIQVLIKPEVLAQYGVNSQAVSHSISTALASYPAGNISSEGSQFTITIDPSVTSTKQLRNLQIPLNGQNILLADIATITDRSGPAQPKSYYATSANAPQRAITFSVFKTQSANIDQAVNDARKIVNEQVKPHQGTFAVASILDTSKEITTSFGNLVGNYRDTLLLVFLTLFIFLGIRQAIIAVTTIPLTFLVTFVFMQATGLTLNFLTLFSLLLSLGLLVDDTIVTVTAMTSYYRTGKFTPTETGLLVWRDFIVPIWSTTITTVWAFIPLVLSTGVIGAFIKSIPIVVSASLYTSTAVAVLITLPLMMVILKPAIAWRVKITFTIAGFILLVGFVYLFIRTNALAPLILLMFIVLLAVSFTIRRALANRLSITAARYIDTKTVKARIAHIANHGIINIPSFAKRYQQTLTTILTSKAKRRKTIFTVALFSLFSYMLVPLGFVTNEFFPKSNEDNLFVSIELPQGTNTQLSNTEATRILDSLRNAPETIFATAEVGQLVESGFGGATGGPNNILVSLTLKPKEHRKYTTTQLAKIIRDQYKNYTTGKLAVTEISGGPPAGADIMITILGDDLTVLDHFADQIAAYLAKQPGVTNSNKSIKPGTSKLVFKPDKAKMASLAITPDAVGEALRTFVSGFTVDSLKVNTKSKDIIIRSSAAMQDPESLSTVIVRTNTGQVPLLSLGTLTPKANPTLVTRQDGKRSIAISAGVTAGYSVTKTNQNLLNYVNSLHLPEGYSFKTGGVNEENQKSVNSILRAMVLAAILILITMVVQLGSFRKAFIVMLVIPLAISGVFIVFALTGTSLSFPALIGMLALFGIVVNNAMMIVYKINQNLSVGMPQLEAITDAAASRLEPILLGSICTIVGLVPITITDPLWRGLGGAIVSGLLFSGTIMLFFIPTVYYMWYHDRE